MRRIVAALPRIQDGKPRRLARSETFALALDVAEADCLAEGLPTSAIQEMRKAYDQERQGSRRRR